MRIPVFTAETIRGYGKFFKPEKLWEKLKKYSKVIGKGSVYYVLVLYYLMISRETPLMQKALIGGALGYLILPLDFIPDYVPVVGFSDDLAAIMTVFNQVKGSITPEIEDRAKQKLSDWFD